MVISSRTPEGEPNRCPVCQYLCRLEPSTPPGDAPCPHCGHLLWFDGTFAETNADSVTKEVALWLRVIASKFGPPSSPVAVEQHLRQVVLKNQTTLLARRIMEATSFADFWFAETGQAP